MGIPPARPFCPRCHRPTTACWCAGLTPIETATRVVFLQHPREAKVAIGTARIAHLGLAGSELHEGIEFADHPRVAELVARPGTALLFPGEGAIAPDALEHPPETLLVIDGTWPQARKMMARNPALRALPRIGFLPRKPGNYRIRREPAAHCVATVEAVVEVLTAFGLTDSQLAPLLGAFDAMVERQLAASATRITPRRQHARPCDPWWTSAAMPDCEALWPELVVVAGEANAHRRGSPVPGLPELIQLAATRLATGETFNAFLAPRRALAVNAARHLEVPEESLVGGRPVESVLADWDRFLGPHGRLVGWGDFSWRLLAQEGWQPKQTPIDLRLVAAHRLKRRPGAVDDAVRAIGGTADGVPSVPGRAGRVLPALAEFIEILVGEKRVAGAGPSQGPARATSRRQAA